MGPNFLPTTKRAWLGAACGAVVFSGVAAVAWNRPAPVLPLTVVSGGAAQTDSSAIPDASAFDDSSAAASAPDALSAAADFPSPRLTVAAAKPEITILAVGDIMLSRTVAERIRQNGAAYPYARLAGWIASAEVAFANLETPLVVGRPVRSGEMSFHSDPGQAKELRQAGFDVVSLANNHTPNAGSAGLASTFQALADAGVMFSGAGKDLASASAPAVVEAQGVRFAFLSYNDPSVVPVSYGATASRGGTNMMDAKRLTADVAAARQQADVVIVSMHAGDEYVARPNRRQVEFAHAAIDAGADAVIGHHPHVVQTAEIYKEKLILYSLGNFIFDQDWSRATQDGLAARLVWRDGRFRRVEFTPIDVNLSQPRTADAAGAERILKRLEQPLVHQSCASPEEGDCPYMVLSAGAAANGE
ncbi:MAG: CapA family protein [Patescibacteria group bacterium]|nr:CapA family protein [Patescibacteria group bacterium]